MDPSFGNLSRCPKVLFWNAASRLTAEGDLPSFDSGQEGEREGQPAHSTPGTLHCLFSKHLTLHAHMLGSWFPSFAVRTK